MEQLLGAIPFGVVTLLTRFEGRYEDERYAQARRRTSPRNQGDCRRGGPLGECPGHGSPGVARARAPGLRTRPPASPRPPAQRARLTLDASPVPARAA